MTQETGETRNAIIEDDNKQIAAIIDANKHRKDPYWILIFAKPSKNCIDAKYPTLIKHIKSYGERPPSYVGAVLGKVDNSTGNIEWEVNMPQKPFDYDALQKFGAKHCDEVVVETTSIPSAYVTK